MKSIFNNLIFSLAIIAFLFSSFAGAQTKTNLSVFYSLSDSLVYRINSELPSSNNKILLELHFGAYSVLSNNIKTAFIKSGKNILEVPPDEINIPTVSIVFEFASVYYGNVYKDGWFGSHFTTRNFNLKGNYFQSFSDNGRQDFDITFSDTVQVDEIEELENDPFPFTKGKIPPEPFLSGLAEPILAIGTAAAIVVLFFSVRSK